MGNVLLLMLGGAVWTLLVFALGAASMHWYLRRRKPEEVGAGEKRCDICHVDLGPRAVKTAVGGLWRCAEHKAMP